jgi:hypothetical protein
MIRNVFCLSKTGGIAPHTVRSSGLGWLFAESAADGLVAQELAIRETFDLIVLTSCFHRSGFEVCRYSTERRSDTRFDAHRAQRTQQ